MKYYLYIPSITQNSVTVYDSEEEIKAVQASFTASKIESFICEFGYPFWG